MPENSITPIESVGAPKKSVSRRDSITGQSSEGHITKHIGSGDNAKNSFIWITLRFCFVIGSVITAAIFLQSAYICDGAVVEDIKSIWSIFVPIITLALGYAFGRGK